MTQQNRKNLKEFFKDGARPTGGQFADLVDSTLNMQDDGFSRTVENGVEIALIGSQKRLLSFFVSEPQLNSPDWCITCEPQDSKLSFVRPGLSDSASSPASGSDTSSAPNGSSPASAAANPSADGSVMNLLTDGTVEVNGTISSHARMGSFGRSDTIDANGVFQDITGILNGCHILEVVAGVGLPGEKKGRYALLHAIAMNTFNPRRYFFNFFFNKRPINIKSGNAWYLDRGDRLQLRWVPKGTDPSDHSYALQLRTMRDYGKGIKAKYSITRLWLDDMAPGA